MSHVVLPNQPQTSSTGVSDGFWSFWKLTRGLLAAGWKYKASGDATASGTKETAGSFLNEKWGVGGGVNLGTTVQSATGSVAFSAAANDGTVTCTFTGTSFTALSVGRMLTVSGAANSINNGTFRIVTFTSATVIKIWNPTATTETTSVTWAEKYGAANGTIATAGTGGATVGRAIFTVSSGTPFVAPVAAPLSRGSVGDRLTISNGAVGANNGHFVITRVISTTQVEIENSSANATGETNNGSLNWTEVSPTAQTEPNSIAGTNGSGAWICLQGPSIMKIPIGTNVPTGTFERGELVTQTTSGATGAIIGVLTDTSGGLGYLVIEPRLNGTTGNPRGWSSTADTVSAAVAPTGSGASISTTGTPVEYVFEMVIWKNSQTTGHLYMQCVDQSGESASRFSVIAASSGSVTNSAAPGVTGTFPTPGSWVVHGTGSTTVGTGWNYWQGWSDAANYGYTHVMVANCIETATESADGSWTVATGTPTKGPGAYAGTAFWRCDDSEDGDVCPYVTWSYGSTNAYTESRTVQTANNVQSNWFSSLCLYVSTMNNGYTPFRSFRRRGFSSGDAFSNYQGACLAYGSANGNYAIGTQNYANTCRVANSVVLQQVREPIWVISASTAGKQRKGSLRWAFGTDGGVANSAFYNATFIQLASADPGSSPFVGNPTVCGPWDGVTQAANA